MEKRLWYAIEKDTENGELLEYYTDDRKTLIAAYGWNSQYSKYRKQTK